MPPIRKLRRLTLALAAQLLFVAALVPAARAAASRGKGNQRQLLSVLCKPCYTLAWGRGLPAYYSLACGDRVLPMLTVDLERRSV